MRADAWTLAPLALLASACCKSNGVQAQQGTLAIEDGQTSVTNGADDFGNVCPGSQATRTLSLVATSAADVDVKAISVSGGGFSVTALPLPLSVPAGTSVPLPIVFSPSSQGPATGTLTVTSDATNPTATVTLTGTGQAGGNQPSYSATCNYPSASGTVTDHPYPCEDLLWDGVVVGSSASDSLTVTDDGCPPLVIQSATISPPPDGGPSPFSVTLAQPASVTPSTPANLNVSYSPSVAGGFDLATLTLVTNDPVNSLPPGGSWSDGGPAPGIFVYQLTGTGLASDVQIDCAGCAGSPPSYDFGAVTEGAMASETFTVLNTGTLPVTLAAPGLDTGAPFSLTLAWDAGTVLAASGGAGDSIPCIVSFTSPGSGIFHDQLLVAYTSSAGNGTAAANLVAHSSGALCPSPNPLVLPGTGYCGTTSALLDLGDCGDANLTVTGVSFATGGAPGFSAAPAGGLTLPQIISADAGLEVLVTYQDDGHLTDPFATLLVQVAPDAGTMVSVEAPASPVPPPGDSPAQLPDSGVGCNVTTAFAAEPGNDAPLYSYTWSIVGSCSSTVTLVSDGGQAWVTPTADTSGVCDICLQAWEQPVDGGFDCHFDAGATGHCTPLQAINNCP